MSDDDWYKPNSTERPPRLPKPGELLFEFVRERDRKHARIELRFNDESYGYEVQVFDGGAFVR